MKRIMVARRPLTVYVLPAVSIVGQFKGREGLGSRDGLTGSGIWFRSYPIAGRRRGSRG